jgi:hypothetical protein
MSGLGVTAVIWLLLAVALTASLCGYAGSAVARRKRRARGPFLLGFFCGSITGALLRRKYRPAARGLVRAASRFRSAF